MTGPGKLWHFIVASSFIIVVGGLTQLANAQSQSQYFISARAGLVNYQRGQVVYRAKSAAHWERLTDQAQLDDGDHIRTKLDGRVEILLNPGSLLRLDTNTEVIMHQTHLPMVELEVASGSAMIEAGDLGEHVILRVKTPHTSLRIKKDGLYRIDATARLTKVSVRKGELEYLARGDMKKLKKDKMAVITGAAIEIVKLEKNQPLDDFDLWVKDRAEILIAANQSLLRRRSFGSRSLYASSWVYDPFYGCYTFVPFGYLYRSPWGGSFIYYAPYYSFYGYGYWPGYYPGGGYAGGGGGSRIPTQPPALTANESKVSLRVGGARTDRGDFTRPERADRANGGRMMPPRMDTDFGRSRAEVFSPSINSGSAGRSSGTVSVPSAPASPPVAAPRTEGGVRETGTRGRGRP